MPHTQTSTSYNINNSASHLLQLPLAAAVGLRFIPTDEELVGYFLVRKIVGVSIPEIFVLEHDLYGEDNPWEIWQKYENQINFNPSDGSKDLYFFTRLKRKKPNAIRVERRIGIGVWQGEDGKIPILSRTTPNVCLGSKKRLRFEKSGTYHDGEYIMHEYSLSASLLPPNFPQSIVNELVLCRIRKNEHHSILQSIKDGNKRKISLKHDKTPESPCKIKKTGQEADKRKATGFNEKEHLYSPGVEREIIKHQQEETNQSKPSTNSEEAKNIDEKGLTNNTLFTIDELLPSEPPTKKSNKLDEEKDLERELLELLEDLGKNNDNELCNSEEENFDKIPMDETFLNGPLNAFSRISDTFGRNSLEDITCFPSINCMTL